MAPAPRSTIWPRSFPARCSRICGTWAWSAPSRPDAVAAAAAAPVVARLETLDLSQGTLGDDGAQALLAGQPLTHLRKLDLSYHFISDITQAVLAVELPGIVDLSACQEEEWEPGYREDGRFTFVHWEELAFMPVEE